MARRRYNSWSEYVNALIELGEKQIDVSRRTGVDQTTLSRWIGGESRGVTSKSVARFARGYGRPVLEAFVAAGFMSAKEAGIKNVQSPDLTKFTDGQLLQEIQRRLGEHLHPETDQTSDQTNDNERNGKAHSSVS